jgi:hypothetical protein
MEEIIIKRFLEIFMFRDNINWYHIEHSFSSPYFVVEAFQIRAPNEEED